MCTGAWLGWLMSGRGKAGYICVLRGNACALVRSVDDIYIYIYIYTNKIAIEFTSKGSLRSPN